LLAAHRWPHPDYAAGRTRRGWGDVDDRRQRRLVQDLGHLAAQSGVRIDVASAGCP